MTRRPDTLITEASFQRLVIALLRRYGWRYYATAFTRRRVKGFPDLIAIKGNQLLALELKTDKGKVAPEQQEWLSAFDRVFGCSSYVLRPGTDLRTITDILDLAEIPFG